MGYEREVKAFDAVHMQKALLVLGKKELTANSLCYIHNYSIASYIGRRIDQLF